MSPRLKIVVVTFILLSFVDACLSRGVRLKEERKQKNRNGLRAAFKPFWLVLARAGGPARAPWDTADTGSTPVTL